MCKAKGVSGPDRAHHKARDAEGDGVLGLVNLPKVEVLAIRVTPILDVRVLHDSRHTYKTMSQTLQAESKTGVWTRGGDEAVLRFKGVGVPKLLLIFRELGKQPSLILRLHRSKIKRALVP